MKGIFMLTALQLIKDQIKSSREGFEGTIGDITKDQLYKTPGGVALPLGAVYAHLIFSEDLAVQKFLQQKNALSESSWKERTGVDKPMESWTDPAWSAKNTEWAKTITIDLAQLGEYKKAVYEATDHYVNSLKDEDLEKEVDLGAWGKMSTASFLTGFIIGHSYNISGEASVLKGLQGAKGYTF